MHLQLINTWLQQQFSDLIAAYLFGSYSQGTQNKESDIDLAILVPRKVDAATLWQQSLELSDLVKKDIDLINLLDVSTVFQFQITSTGQRIVCNHPSEAEAYETLVFTKYVKLNEARAGILNDIKQRGSIYG